MRASCIRHPAGERLIILREWQIEACDGDRCAGFLLSFFEWCHNFKLEQLSQSKAYNDTAESHGDERTQLESLLQWHTEEDLEAALLGEYGRKKIREALTLIESKGYIERMGNPNPKYKFDRTGFFQFRAGVVNAWLEEHRSGKVNTDGVIKPNADEAKLPYRESQKAAPSGKKAAPSGINAASFMEPSNGQSNNLSNGDNVLALFGTMSHDELTDVGQLPPYLSPIKTATPEVWLAVVKVCKIPLFTKPTKAQAIGLNDVTTALSRGGLPANAVYEFEKRWYGDWMGKEGSPPTPRQIRENWGRIMSKRTPELNGHPPNAAGGISKLLQMQQERRQHG